MSSTYKKLGIEFKDFSQAQINEAVFSIQSMRLEQILMAEGEIFDWQNLFQRPDLVQIQNPEKLGTITQEEEQKLDKSFFLFSQESKMREYIMKLIKTKNYGFVQFMLAAISIIPYCIYIDGITLEMEIIINIFFGFDALLKSIAFGLIMGNKAYLRDTWNVVNFLAFLFTWTIFLEGKTDFILIIQAIRLLRVFRLIEEVSFLKIQFSAYVSSFLKLRSVLIPIVLVMVYFSIIGLHLFRGLTEQRCRLTPEPVNGVWEADLLFQKLCGIYQCPENLYCGNPIDYSLPKNSTENDYEAFSWDFIRFDDFFHSLLVVFTFLNVTGWSGTTFMFWKAMTTYVTATYFLVLIVLLAFILSNLLLALFYESFMEKSSIKSTSAKVRQEQKQIEEEIKKKKQLQLMNRLQIMSKQKGQSISQNINFNIYFNNSQKQVKQKNSQYNLCCQNNSTQVLNNFFILLSAIAILVDYPQQQQLLKTILNTIDFVCICYTFFELVMSLYERKLTLLYYSNLINIFDILINISQWILIIYLFIKDDVIVNNKNRTVILIKSLKILKILKFVNNAKMLYIIQILTRSLIGTLIKLKNMLCLWICLILFLAIIGQHFLINKINDSKITIHFNDILSSIMATINIFYNEEWIVTMFKYGRKTNISIAFYILSVIFGQVFFIRLLMAVFINEFVKQIDLNKISLKPIDFYLCFRMFLDKFKFMKQKEQNQQLNQSQKINLTETQNNNPQQNIIRLQKKANSMILKFAVHQENAALNEDEQLNWLKFDAQQVVQPQNSSSVQIENLFKKVKGNKSLFIFSENNSIRIIARQIVESISFRIFLLLTVIASTIRVSFVTPFLNPDSELHSNLQIISRVTTIIFCIQVILNTIANGFLFGKGTYIQQSPYNIVNFIITIAEVASQFFATNLIFNFLSSLRVIEFIRIGAELNKSINYVSQALIKAFLTMTQLSFFCFIILLLYGIFATKMLQNSLYYCSTLSNQQQINDKWDCMDYGGSWVNKILSYDNIFESVLTLFITATTEAWLFILVDTWSARGENLAPIQNYNRWWAAYFQIFFFIGNICMLNMFISLVVNTYQETKIKAQGLLDLNDNQREWISIKNNINYLQPKIIFQNPKNLVFRVLYFLAFGQKMKYFWHIIILLNSICLALTYSRQDEHFQIIQEYINICCIFILFFWIILRIILRFFGFKNDQIFLIVDILGISINLFEILKLKQISTNLFLLRSIKAVSVAFQLSRNYFIVKRFPELEKLFKTVFSVIPSALAMIFIMTIFLFIYTQLGMDLFGYLRVQSNIDGFDLHFRKFTTAMFSLIRVASSEYWYALLVDCVHQKSPDFACINMSNYDDYIKYGYNGCGTYWAYVYYISFHLIFSLVILNLFIASILGAYEEHAKQEQSAISKYQLHDVLNYWAQYDPKGTGFLNYKQFWKLSSEIAICFGVPVKELLDPANKKNFLKALNISLYEDGDGLMGYLFHDVIVSLTRLSVELKYGVRDLESSSYQGKEFVHNYYKKFKLTPYVSGQMSTIIYLQGKARFLVNKKRGIKFLDLDALKKELQNQNEAELNKS